MTTHASVKLPQGVKAGGEGKEVLQWMLLEQRVSSEIQLYKRDKCKRDMKR